MENIPITIRVAESSLQIIDEYALRKKITRADILRRLVNELAENIAEKESRKEIIAASRKIGKKTIEEYSLFEDTLEDGLNDE